LISLKKYCTLLSYYVIVIVIVIATQEVQKFKIRTRLFDFTFCFSIRSIVIGAENTVK